MRFLTLLWGLCVALPSWAAAPQVADTSKVSEPGRARTLQITWTTGDSGDSTHIPNSCSSWGASASLGAGADLDIYAIDDSGDAATSGTLLASFTASSAAVTKFETSYPFLKATIVIPGTGTSRVWLYCMQESSASVTDAAISAWTSVTEYGALCDGTTDDTAAIQAALDDARGSWTGGTPPPSYAKTITIPPRTSGSSLGCVITDTLTIGGGVTLRGQSVDATISAHGSLFPSTTANEPMIAIGQEHYGAAQGTRAQNVQIHGFTLNANTRARVGIRLDGVEQRTRIDNMTINQFGDDAQYGIQMEGDPPDNDGGVDLKLEHLNIYWSTSASPKAGSAAIWLDGSNDSFPIWLGNMTLNGWDGADADSNGLVIKDYPYFFATEIYGEKWGNALIKIDNSGPGTVIGARTGNGPVSTVNLTGSGGRRVALINVRGDGTTVGIQDDQMLYTSAANSGEMIYLQGGYSNGVFLREGTPAGSGGNGPMIKIAPHDASIPNCTQGGGVMKGAIYYDTSLDKFCYCNGAVWAPMDGAAAGSATNCG